MQGVTLILMLKNDGIIEKELATVKISKNGEVLRSMHVTGNDGDLTVHLYVTVCGDLKDWEFEAVYDYYDTGIYDGLDLEITEIQDDINPVWDISFPYIDNAETLAKKCEGILNLHKRDQTFWKNQLQQTHNYQELS